MFLLRRRGFDPGLCVGTQLFSVGLDLGPCPAVGDTGGLWQALAVLCVLGWLSPGWVNGFARMALLYSTANPAFCACVCPAEGTGTCTC